MKTIQLSEAELAMIRNAMHSYLNDFGHDEHEILALAKTTLAKLDAASDPSSELIG